MPRPFTRAQSLENAAFLRALRQTGNAREAARSLGRHRAMFTKRRASHPAFAAQWDAALAVAHAALGEKASKPVREPRLHRLRTGRLQLRRAQPGRLDRAAEQRFLAALSASANVRLAAKAAGFAHATFYARRRNDAAFAREWRLALEEGYERLELALFESSLPHAFEHDHWRHNERPATPPMTANQALQLMYLHQKEARLGGTPAPLRLRPGETPEERSVRLTLMRKGYEERERERYRIAEAMRLAEGKPTFHEWAAGELPDLSQIVGWSKASGKPAADEGRALFGGWRIEEMRGRTDKDD